MKPKLDQAEVDHRLSELPGWKSEGGEISKEFAWPTYKDGLAFAVAIGWAADQVDHHPDLFIGYRKVRVSLSSHDAGGVTTRDFSLARKIEDLATGGN